MKFLKAAIDWWTAWVSILALPIFIGIILLQYFQPSLDGELFCKSKEPCIQQWVGALSGWFSGIATLGTVLFVVAQMRQADKHHTEAILIANRPLVALATAVRTKALHAKAALRSMADVALEAEPVRAAWHFTIAAEKIGEKTFLEFEDKAGLSQIEKWDEMRASIRAVLNHFERTPPEKPFGRVDLHVLKIYPPVMMQYCDVVIEAAEEIIHARLLRGS